MLGCWNAIAHRYTHTHTYIYTHAYTHAYTERTSSSHFPTSHQSVHGREHDATAAVGSELPCRAGPMPPPWLPEEQRAGLHRD